MSIIINTTKEILNTISTADTVYSANTTYKSGEAYMHAVMKSKLPLAEYALAKQKCTQIVLKESAMQKLKDK